MIDALRNFTSKGAKKSQKKSPNSVFALAASFVVKSVLSLRSQSPALLAPVSKTPPDSKSVPPGRRLSDQNSRVCPQSFLLECNFDSQSVNRSILPMQISLPRIESNDFVSCHLVRHFNEMTFTDLTTSNEPYSSVREKIQSDVICI